MDSRSRHEMGRDPLRHPLYGNEQWHSYRNKDDRLFRVILIVQDQD